MIPIRILASSFATFVIVSCAPQKNDAYDTSNPSGVAASAATSEPANPVYDTPAAYEETSGVVSSVPTVPTSPQLPATAAPAAPVRPANGAAIIHTVVAGDTLSGLSAKYKVPSAAIKQANGMTKDTVVLGRKMVIPPVQ
jgi:LysM repeat protein